MINKDKLEIEIEKIKERNARVETDKAWETSQTRRIVATIFIYVLSAVILFSINAPSPFVNALIPAVGFLFSIETFPLLKEFWIRNIYKKR